MASTVAEEGIGRGDDANTLLESILRDAQGFSADLNGSSESMGRIVVAENAVETGWRVMITNCSKVRVGRAATHSSSSEKSS